MTVSRMHLIDFFRDRRQVFHHRVYNILPLCPRIHDLKEWPIQQPFLDYLEGS